MLRDHEIVPSYATLERIINKPHTLSAEVVTLRERFPDGDVQEHLDILMDRLGHFIFREEDPPNVVALHRRAIELVGETLAVTPGMNETEVAVAIKTVLADGGSKYQEMDSPDYPVVPLRKGVFARKPAPRETTTAGLLFYLEFLRLQEKRNAPEEMPSGEISFDIETTPGEILAGTEDEQTFAFPLYQQELPPVDKERVAKKEILRDYLRRSNKREILRDYLSKHGPLTNLFCEPPTDSRNYPPAIMRDPDFQEALRGLQKSEQSEEDGDDKTDE